METIVRDNWPSRCRVDILFFTEKEKECLHHWNPTLVFEYEKSRYLVGTNFRCINERNISDIKYHVASPKCSDNFNGQIKQTVYILSS